MPPRKSKKNKNTKVSTRARASVIVQVNSHNRRKSSNTKATAPSSNHSPPFMILQQPAPHQQYLPQPSISDQQISYLAQAIRQPFLQDLAIEQERKTDVVRETENRDDLQQKIRNEEMKRKRLDKYRAIFEENPLKNINPFYGSPQRQDNIHSGSVLDSEAVLPRSEYDSYMQDSYTPIQSRNEEFNNSGRVGEEVAQIERRGKGRPPRTQRPDETDSAYQKVVNKRLKQQKYRENKKNKENKAKKGG